MQVVVSSEKQITKTTHMKMKATVVVAGVVGAALIVYGSIAQSPAGLAGLALAVAAIVAAGFFRSAPRSERDERGAKAAVIAAVIGH